MGDNITLPWPDKALSPNSRKDRRYTGDIRQSYRKACWALCNAAKLDRSLTHLNITFHPPDGRKRDLDNMLGAIKYGLDGMALALGVDDYDWSMTIRRGEKDAAKLGRVVIALSDPITTDIPHRWEIG